MVNGMEESLAKTERVQTYGRKKTAVAVALCKTGNGLMRINGCPLDLIKPEVLKMKVTSKARGTSAEAERWCSGVQAHLI